MKRFSSKNRNERREDYDERSRRRNDERSRRRNDERSSQRNDERSRRRNDETAKISSGSTTANRCDNETDFSGDLDKTNDSTSPVYKRMKSRSRSNDLETIQNLLKQALDVYEQLEKDFDDTRTRFVEEFQSANRGLHERVNRQKACLLQLLRDVNLRSANEDSGNSDDSGKIVDEHLVNEDVEQARLEAIRDLVNRNPKVIEAEKSDDIESRRSRPRTQSEMSEAIRKARQLRTQSESEVMRKDRNEFARPADIRYPPVTMLKFPKLPDPISKKTNWINYRSRIVSAIDDQDCNWLIKDPVVPPVDMNEAEIAGRIRKVKNFFIANTHDELLHVVKNHSTPYAMLQALDQHFDPRGGVAIYSLMNQLNLIHFDPDAESATEFNARFSDLVERVRKITPDYSEDEEKRAFILAVKEAAKETIADDKFEKRMSGKGLSVTVLMERFVIEENERKESERR